jgi:hypothetical protein
MDPVLIMIPGFLGGVVVAFALSGWRRRRHARRSNQIAAPGPPSTDAINISSIRVAGIGGLGLVAMALAVAWNIPRIGQSMALGLLLGVVMAVALIVARRRVGSMPSSGRHGGANVVLAIENRAPTPELDLEEEARGRRTTGLQRPPSRSMPLFLQ